MSDESPLAWTDDGQPRSRLYGDVYFSAEDGLAETRAVFLQGCGLPDAWAERRTFTVGELGFGTGLNILALLDLWRRTAPPAARLHVFSIEAHPITAEEASRALSRWPELADLVDLLVNRWPGRARGFHRVDLPEVDAVLDLAVMDVESALTDWTGQADAWFLDGFSPALNPAMWREEIMALVAARSAPGAHAATFTVAGAVRRGLSAAGFEVDKRPGFGRKRERLEARLPGAVLEAPPRKVAVVGAGIAGASAARALRALGCDPVVIDAQGPGAGASGNPAALVTPRLDAGLGPLAHLFAQAFARAGRLYGELPDAIIARSVLQLASGERDLDRFAKIAASDLFEPDALALLDIETASARLGEPSPAPALDLATALVVEPAAILSAWTGPILRTEVADLTPTEGGWRLLDAASGTIMEAEAVILTIGPSIGALLDGLPIGPVRGQASWTDAVTAPQAAAWGGYAVPTRNGLLFGATHDRGETATDVRAADHDRNRATLAAALPGLAARLGELEGRASVRATTPDHLPLAGEAPGMAGVHVLGGLGSRGFCLAPLLAEHVAAQVLGRPSPLPAPLAELVAPDRFQKRAARKGRSLAPEPAKGT